MNGFSDTGDFYGDGLDAGDQDHNGDGMMMMGQDGMVGGQSLDEIVNQNAKAMRRQSMPLTYGHTQSSMDGTGMRRMPMMDYGAGSPAGVMGNLQYDPNNSIDQSGMMAGNATPINDQRAQHRSRRPSASNLGLNTSYNNTPQGYNTMMHPNSAYASPAHPPSGFDLALDNAYGDSALAMSVENNMDQNFGSASGSDVSHMNMYNQQRFNQAMMNSPMHPGGAGTTPLSGRTSSQDNGGGSGMNTVHSGVSTQTSGQHASARHHLSRSHSLQINDVSSPAHGSGTPMSQPVSAHQGNHAHQGFPAQQQHPIPGSQQDRGMHNTSSQFDGLNGPQPVKPAPYNPNNQGFSWDTPEGGWPSTMVGRPHTHSVYKNVYSSTGFDMLGVLMRVATRENPEINIGAVDLSCAFVVCDAEKDDFPIVYCSENFERLTGYTKHMILGRNCRFLQSPDGNVAPGVPRKYVDDNSVLYLKNMITLRREAQISLINYRRGGQPFMNLLTMIPISWNTDQVKFFVGFQVDLVEQPNAVTNKNPDGSYSINYQRGMTMPRYILNPPDTSQTTTDLGQTVPRDDVSAILATFGSGESDYAKRMWDKVLLENTDDVVHVLSLKGLFQWVSPSAARVLEYEPGEIIGTALSSVCHPSDIVPVTRELKDTSTGATVNVVFRIRRKNSGYMWFDGHGSLHTEQGKGRKSIILVGRERPVYTLSKSDIQNNGGVGENELWTKMSTSGMFLYVSSNVRQLLDRQPDDMVGVSMQSLMRTDSKAEFGRILEHARTGKKASVKHEMINRRGQVLSAYTTLYPGDATEGSKPTFIVAQTRLIKFSRTIPTPRPSIYAKQDRLTSDQSVSTTNVQTGADASDDTMHGSHTPSGFQTTDGSAVTYAGSSGLVIGRQDASLASEDNLFDELKTTKSSSWQYEIRQLEKKNRMLAEEVQSLLAAKKKRKRRRGKDLQKDCANCHTRVTPEWRRGPSGQRDLCNSCGLRWAKLNGRVSPRTSSQQSVHSAASDKASKASATSASPRNSVSMANVRTPLKTESPDQAQRPQGPGVEPRESPKATRPPEGHAASMEGASGVPDKIDEGIESE